MVLEWFSTRSALADGTHQDDQYAEFGDDAPATPAPVFAARAFKNLIWGTPAPEEIIKQRRGTQRRASEPHVNQVQTTPRRAMSGNSQKDYLLEPSPARRAGILVTPGTAGGRKKNVSFQASSKHMATPRDYPGRFPSPFTVKKDLAVEIQESDANLLKAKSATASKTTTNRTARAPPTATTATIPSFDDITLDMNAPRSTSGTFWKKEHDLGQQEHNAYASKSTSQLSRIAKKEQLAKRYARDKENEAAQLADALRHEQMRVAELEKQVAEYVAQLARAVKKYGEHEDDVEEHRQRPLTKNDKLESRKMGSPRRPHLQPIEQTKPEAESRTSQSHRTSTQTAPRAQPDSSDIWAAPEPSIARPSRTRSRTDLATTNTTTTAATTTAATTRSPLQSRTPNPLMSSPFPESAKAPTSSRSYRRHVEPLQETNLPAVEERQSKAAMQEAHTTTTTATTLSEERKLAAKRRLEEKKRARSAVA